MKKKRIWDYEKINVNYVLIFNLHSEKISQINIDQI